MSEFELHLPTVNTRCAAKFGALVSERRARVPDLNRDTPERDQFAQSSLR